MVRGRVTIFNDVNWEGFPEQVALKPEDNKGAWCPRRNAFEVEGTANAKTQSRSEPGFSKNKHSHVAR